MGRRPKQHGPDIDGLLVVDKPLGVSSMDVVRVVRRAALGVRTGHAGTLDPLASGVLIVCLGKGTKLVEQLMGAGKTYRAEIDLSAFTPTDDREGEREEVTVTTPPARVAIEAVLPEFTGTIQQRPPAYSAIKIAGKPAYQRARSGEELELKARPVRIDDLTIEAYAWPILTLSINCGRGTYIRSLARALGTRLGTGGHLASLVRTRVGSYGLEQAIALDSVPTPLTQAAVLPLPQSV